MLLQHFCVCFFKRCIGLKLNMKTCSSSKFSSSSLSTSTHLRFTSPSSKAGEHCFNQSEQSSQVQPITTGLTASSPQAFSSCLFLFVSLDVFSECHQEGWVLVWMQILAWESACCFVSWFVNLLKWKVKIKGGATAPPAGGWWKHPVVFFLTVHLKPQSLS